MPKYIDEEVGKVIRRRKVKTFGDRLKEFGEGVLGFIFVIGLLYFIFT
ncbi:MAG: hypothetical protein ACU0GG_13770 [Paracoccaceae bacterium]